VAIDPAFTGAQGDLYWTSTQNEGAPTLSWAITFNLGVVDGISVTGLGYARCVRHIEPPPTNVDGGQCMTGACGPSTGSSCGCEVGPGAGAKGWARAALFASVLAVLPFLHRRRRTRQRKARA